MSHPKTVSLNVLVFPEGPFWIGQCLEHDIVCQADNPSDIPKKFSVILQTILRQDEQDGCEFLSRFKQAPAKFIHTFIESLPLNTSERSVQFDQSILFPPSFRLADRRQIAEISSEECNRAVA